MKCASILSGLTALTLVAGCGGGASPGSDSGSNELTSVKVGYVPYADDAPAFLAQEKGIFRKHGLDVEFVPASNPTAIVSAMVSGEYQFGFVTDPVLINVNAQGTPLKCASPVVGRQPSNTERDGTTLVSAKGSGIDKVADLAGKKVALVQLNSLNSLDVQVLATKAGIDHKSIQFIQMPFPQMPTAMKQGRVDAAIIVQPFAQIAIDQGANVINHPNAELWGGGTTVCFSALDDYIQQNEDVVKGFNTAMREAIAYTKNHEAEAKATLTKHLDLTKAEAQKQVLQTDWNSTLETKTIAAMQNYMKQFGLIKETVPAQDMVWEGAR
jgi:NitT/TauT family transport system substrate-binding protein